MGRPVFSPGEKTDWGGIPTCYTGNQPAKFFDRPEFFYMLAQLDTEASIIGKIYSKLPGSF